MERRLVGILLSLLTCSGLGRALAADSNAAPAVPTLAIGDMPLVFWQPGESYQEGSQFDSRLDKPVRLWRAGTPLREVFADLTRQTGVEFDFLAPEKDEPRICVTFYLNPEQPPSLRAVMAQLNWVTGCLFAYTEPRAESRAYHLLWTSVGQGTAGNVAAQAAAWRAQLRAEMDTRRDTQREAAAKALEESKAALALAQEEAIARYRGVNDALLLNLLDPSRRAGLSFLASLPEADAKELVDGGAQSISREWSAWSTGQQTVLMQALGLDQQQWPKEGHVSISLRGGRGGALTATVETEQGRRLLGRVAGLLSRGDVRRNQEIALQRYLGEIRTPEQETAARQEQQDARRAAQGARREQWSQQRAQAMAATRALDPARESLLSSLTLPDAGSDSSLWQLQEAVAKATRLNVVSDCFWPPRPGFGPRRSASSQPTNALDAVSAACTSVAQGFGRGFGGVPGDDLSVEWGDAGTFLRFRSRRPDLWRAALLPTDVQAQLDRWLEPLLASSNTSPQPGDAPLSGDLEKLSWLAGHLNDLQVLLGGTVPYEDPSDPTGARRQALRRAALQQVALQMPLLRMMATFTPEQWARAGAEGLRWGSDLTPDQQSAALSRMGADAVPENRLNDLVIKLGQTEARTIQQRDGTQRTIPSLPALTLVLDGTVINQIQFSSGWWRGGRGGGPPGGFRGGGPGP